MASALMRTGISVVGDVPWGTHLCQFYETKEDLLNTVVPFFKAGLEDGEFCVWVVSEPVSEDEAWSALQRVLPDLDRYVSGGSIEMFPAREWYLERGKLELQRVTSAWNDKLSRALARGYRAIRASGSVASLVDRFHDVAVSAMTGEGVELLLGLSNVAWLQKKDWKDLCEYEAQFNSSIMDQPMGVLCAYPLMTCGAAELLDVARNHQFVIATRQGSWQVIETTQLKRAGSQPWRR